jgi:hypothetical protein
MGIPREQAAAAEKSGEDERVRDVSTGELLSSNGDKQEVSHGDVVASELPAAAGKQQG